MVLIFTAVPFVCSKNIFGSCHYRAGQREEEAGSDIRCLITGSFPPIIGLHADFCTGCDLFGSDNGVV